MTEQEKIRWSYDMGIAVLLGPTIYNISELLDKEVLKALGHTEHKWLSDLLYTLNGGNINEFNSVLAKYKEVISNQEQILSNLPTLNVKVRVLQLIELIFLREKGNRNLTFASIAESCQITIKEVEWLVMKAMSLKLIKGEVDEIEGLVRISWVIPRYLDKQRILVMQSKFHEWKEKTNKVLKDYESLKQNLVEQA
jgi:26S proteasome regulatory subunit N9